MGGDDLVALAPVVSRREQCELAGGSRRWGEARSLDFRSKGQAAK